MGAIANHGLLHVNFNDENWFYIGDSDSSTYNYFESNNQKTSHYLDMTFLKQENQFPFNEPIYYKIREEFDEKQTLANIDIYSYRYYQKSDCDSGKSQFIGAEFYEKSNLQGEAFSFSKSMNEAPWENFESHSFSNLILYRVCREISRLRTQEWARIQEQGIKEREEKELAKQKELDKKIRELRLAREMKQAKEEKEREAKEKAKEQRRLELQKKAEEKKLERFCNKAGNFDLKECSAVKKKKIEEERRSLAAQNYCDDYDEDCLQKIVKKQYGAMQTCNGPSAGITEEMGRWLLATCIRIDIKNVNACYRVRLNNWKNFILEIRRMQQINHYCK